MDLALFFEIHKEMPRQGPGEAAATIKALEMASALPPAPAVLDIGCGPGAQTIVLAQETGSCIYALDKYQCYLDELKSHAAQAGLSQQVQLIRGCMTELPFKPHSFDLIWSEGAVYLMGFDQGLRAWKSFLKSGGYLAVSELCWFSEDVPAEAVEYMRKCYPAMRHYLTNKECIEKLGFKLCGMFNLPESAWWNDYYGPLEIRAKELLNVYRGNAEAEKLIEMDLLEIEIYRKYSSFYGYTFYIMQA